MGHLICNFLKLVLCLAALILGAGLLSTGVAVAQSAKTIFANVSGQVSDVNGRAIPAVNVHLDGRVHLFQSADASGHFVFPNVPPGTYSIRLEKSGYRASVVSDIVVTNEDVALNVELAATPEVRTLAQIVTTASGSINVAPAPSYAFTPSDLSFQGQTQWRQILEEAPGVSVSGFVNGTLSTVAGSPINDAVISVRGALPYETAMLIDNMPMFSASPFLGAGGGVNLSPYDPQAFGSFDIVAGPGAQSPSIVNSIGGSVNFHPAGQLTQNRYSFSIGNDPYGGTVGQGLTAVRFGNLSATATYGFNDSDGPIQTTQLLGPGFGRNIESINGQFFACNFGFCGHFTHPAGAGAFTSSGFTTGLIGCCDSQVFSGWQGHTGSLSLFYPISTRMDLQLFFAGDSHTAGFLGAYTPTFFKAPAGYVGSFPAGSTTPVLRNGFLNEDVAESSQIYEGKLTFQLGQGQLQLAALNNLSSDVINESNPTSPLSLSLSGGGTFYPNTSVPVIFNGGVYQVQFLPTTIFESFIVNNRDLSASYATPIGNNARGALSYVRGYYDSPTSETINATFVVPPGVLNNFSLFTPPQSNYETTDQVRLGFGVDPSNSTAIDLSYYLTAAKYHVLNPADQTQSTYVDQSFHYSAPRLSFVWRPNSAWAVRASTGGGFALGPLEDYVGTNSGIDCSSGVFCTQAISNINLQPETSWGSDLGFDNRVASNTTLSFDVYRTDLQGQVYNDTVQTGMFSGLPLFTNEFSNLGHSRYEGIETDLRRNVSRGTVWGASASMMRGYIVSLPPGFYDGPGCMNCSNQLVVPGINLNGLFTGANVPYAQGFAMYGYRWSPEHFVNIEAHYFGKNNGYFAPAFVGFDANAQIALNRNVSLQWTLHNITGVHGNAVLNTGEGIILPTAFGDSAYVDTVPYGPRSLLVTFHIHS